ncbi:glutathione synthase [Allofrancisella guangzhouensis]|uniref:Glutathione synthetase n=1 Tax=Allofrancisella guangzhouensis TaxID=594679 RepID=A0A0A8E3X4_9GAMM|nr:glutathione synthase [Allofrancisella guangzhouensis]AJC48925.1 glutathione synthetase [Allofrancisella guangzhouensis]MBK2027110.1 glutathione synthase [Allofrancisella guangzhouensis]MBK2044104.1 glutathione synthase [Allofrancisella guangzhouensis]MBK2045652.1 glutathione synthase [Allofrancisella guangzhouensis]
MKIGFIIDDLNSFNISKDSTFMMLLAAQDKGWGVYTFYLNDLYIDNGKPKGDALEIKIHKDKSLWYEIISQHRDLSLLDLDCIFMRKDPPFNMEYIYVTYMLDLAKKANVLIVNNPQALRDFNEKVAISNYPKYSPNTLITRNYEQINRFYEQYKDIIVKPLDGMGGSSIFRIKEGDKNKNVILETLTYHQTKYIMVQDYQEAISKGDKRILIVNGEPIKYLLARIPSDKDNRGNLAAGATAEIRLLEDSDYKIAKKVAKKLKKYGVMFAGIDVIGDKLTEINITSPTGIQEIYKATKINAASLLMQAVEQKIHKIRHRSS